MRLTYCLGACAALAFATTSPAADTPIPAAPVVAAPGCVAPECSNPSCTKCSKRAAKACSAHGKSNCGLCGMKQYPLLEKRYIKQFCQPTIAPGSCFGHFQTQWTPWPIACPNWHENELPPAHLNWGPPAKNEGIPDPLNPGPVRIPPAQPGPAPIPLKEPAPVAPKDTIPTPKEVKPTTPPKGSVPEKSGKLDERGLVLPPVPEIPASTRSRF